MKSRYIYCPMTSKRIGRRVTILDRIRRARARRKLVPDMFPVTGYFSPVFPGKK